MALTALVCLGFTLLAVWDRRRLVAAGSSEPALAGATANSMGLVWAWAALSMLLTYRFVLSWHEWWQYVLAAGAIAAACLYFASMMSKDAAAGRQDDAILNIARYLTIGQLAGMVIAMIGMIIDDKMPRDPHEPDWAANAIFFFGAAALSGDQRICAVGTGVEAHLMLDAARKSECPYDRCCRRCCSPSR